MADCPWLGKKHKRSSSWRCENRKAPLARSLVLIEKESELWMRENVKQEHILPLFLREGVSRETPARALLRASPPTWRDANRRRAECECNYLSPALHPGRAQSARRKIRGEVLWYLGRNIQTHVPQSAAAPPNAITRPGNERGWHLLCLLLKYMDK